MDDVKNFKLNSKPEMPLVQLKRYTSGRRYLRVKITQSFFVDLSIMDFSQFVIGDLGLQIWKILIDWELNG